MTSRDDPSAAEPDDRPPTGGPTPAHWALFALRAARRRWWITTMVFLAGLAGSIAFYEARVPMYRVESKILVQRQNLPSAVRGGAADELPTRSAWELVHRRENLVAVLRQAGLGAEDAQRSASATPGLARALRRGAAKGEDPLAVLVRRLDATLAVMVDGGTITISLDWPDPQQAHRLVQAAQQNFLEARHVQEITAMDEVISTLSARASALEEELERVIAEVRTTASRARDTAVTSPQPASARPAQLPEDVLRLKAMLDAKERAIQDVEEFRRRRLADLQAQLDQMRGIYSDTYPAVVTLRQDIAALSRESPQIAALREEERALRQEYEARVLAAPHAPAPPRAAPATAALPPRTGTSQSGEDERIREARFQYQRMVERLGAAQVELDAARAAFKYRYNVIWPAQVPRDPVSPNAAKILGAGVVASLLLGVLAAAGLDLRAGKVLERWQLERGLDVPVLAVFRPR